VQRCKSINGIDNFLFEDKIYISNYGEIYNKSQTRLFDYESSSINLKVVNGTITSFSRWNLTTNNFDISNSDYENKRRLKKISYGYTIQNQKQFQKNKIKKILEPKVIVKNESSKDSLNNIDNNNKSNVDILNLELYKFMHNEILNQKIHLETKIRDVEEKIKQKTEINNKYINTIIYMIRPKRNNFYMYIGHTTDKARRLKEHIRSTENDNTKLYNTIRETGGWGHWEMIEICSYECKCREDALKIEQQWCEKLRPNLNSTSPFA
jgi:predicted GIY-YIG superfamily endonuclease